MTVDSSLDTTALDQLVTTAGAAAPVWVDLPLEEKIALLDGVRPRILAESDAMTATAARHKGIAPDSPWVAEEWLTSPWAFLQGVNAHLTVLRRIAAGKEPIRESAVRSRPSGQTVVDVFPVTKVDSLLFSGYGAEVWIQPGISPGQVRQDAARQYRGTGHHDPGVALALGAGNVGVITALDVLDMLYFRGDVVIVKMNPVNDYLGEFYERIFGEFVSRGFVQFAYGGAEVGGYLVHHEGIDSLHMTGSAATHDAIVWGTGEEGARRRRENAPLIDKPFSSELGGVSPLVVVPGEWSEADLRFQAEHIVTSKVNNSGHNCIGTQVLVLPAEWELSDRLLDHVRDVLRELPPRPQYYPRATDRVAAAVEGHGSVELYADDTCALVPDLDVEMDASLLREEVFGGALGVVRLPGATAAEFLATAVAFANDRLPGTLGMTIVIDPATRKANAEAFDRALEDLRYGTIGVNAWSALAFLLGYTTWGAYPGHTSQDIGSGTGVVHNAFLLHDVQKCVTWMPFRPAPRAILGGEYHSSPKPPFFVTHRQGLAAAKRLVHFMATDKKTDLPGIFAAALRG